jgi:hypothetical protein
MEKENCGITNTLRTFALLIAIALGFLTIVSTGGGGGGVVDSGATLEGNVISTVDIKVSIGEQTVTTDEQGNFKIENIPVGDNVVRFESVPTGELTIQADEDINAEYRLIVKEPETIILRDIEINGEEVVTEHTGTWTGTAGSNDPGSDGQLAFTMYILANGNLISGTGVLLGGTDNSVWEVEGTETGVEITGEFHLISSNSSCATGGTFDGTFSGVTIYADFIEVDPPDGCGDPESGSFTLEKE